MTRPGAILGSRRTAGTGWLLTALLGYEQTGHSSRKGIPAGRVNHRSLIRAAARLFFGGRPASDRPEY